MKNIVLLGRGAVGGYLDRGCLVIGAYRAIRAGFLAVFASILLVTPAWATLSIENAGVSNITATNATIYGNVAGTNGTNPVVTICWGQGDMGTNIFYWQYTNNLGTLATGIFSYAATNLYPATYYYFTFRASETTNTAWSGSSNWLTLARAPTSWPAMTNDINLKVASSGLFKTPSKAAVIAANGLATTNDVATIGILSQRVDAAEGAITTNAESIVTNAGGISTNAGNISTNTGNITINAGGISTNAGNLTAHTTNTVNPHEVTAAQADAVPTPTNIWPTGYVLTTSDGGTTTHAVAAGAGDFMADGSVAMAADLNGGGNNAANFANIDAFNAATNEFKASFQLYSATIASAAGGTCTVVYANGPMLKLTATTTPTTIYFDNSGYALTTGVYRVGIDVWAGTNTMAFVVDNVSNAVAPVFTNSIQPASLFFRKSCTNTIWTGRQ